jgi:hypothetical protein
MVNANGSFTSGLAMLSRVPLSMILVSSFLRDLSHPLLIVLVTFVRIISIYGRNVLRMHPGTLVRGALPPYPSGADNTSIMVHLSGTLSSSS